MHYEIAVYGEPWVARVSVGGKFAKKIDLKRGIVWLLDASTVGACVPEQKSGGRKSVTLGQARRGEARKMTPLENKKTVENKTPLGEDIDETEVVFSVGDDDADRQMAGWKLKDVKFTHFEVELEEENRGTPYFLLLL